MGSAGTEQQEQGGQVNGVHALGCKTQENP